MQEKKIRENDSERPKIMVKKFRLPDEEIMRQHAELLSRRSYFCLSSAERKYIDGKYDYFGEDMGKKMFIILISSIVFYYSIFQLLLPYAIDVMGMSEFDLMVIGSVCAALFIGAFFLFILKKDFGKTRVMIYTIIYSTLSWLGVITFITQLIPLTAYQILNTFIYVFFIQMLVFWISMWITRVFVCRISVNEHIVMLDKLAFDDDNIN